MDIRHHLRTILPLIVEGGIMKCNIYPVLVYLDIEL